MNNYNYDKYLNIVNLEREKRGLNDYSPICPMFRVQDGKLYIVVGLVNDSDNVWSKEENIKPDYWALIDINTEAIIEFNKTEEKDFAIGDIIPKIYNNKDKEISKYTIEKTLQYKEYFKEDMKKFKSPLQEKLAEILGNEVEVDGQLINVDDYIFANLEEQINEKLNKLVEMLVWNKYGSISFYYDILFKQVISEYKNNNKIDLEMLKLCAKIMNNYYAGVAYIDNLFNI